jgi:hypothetical protein
MTHLTVCRPLVQGGRIAILTVAERRVERTGPPLDKSTLVGARPAAVGCVRLPAPPCAIDFRIGVVRPRGSRSRPDDARQNGAPGGSAIGDR